VNHVVGSIIARVSTNVLSFVTLILVGRYLSPADFGVFAVASAVVAAPQTIAGAGFYEHLLARDPDRTDGPTAFWCAVMLGVISFLGMLAAAAISWFGFHASTISLLLLGLAFHPLLSSLYVAHEACQLREGNGRNVAFILVTADVVAFGALVLSLIIDRSVYCLLVNRIVTAVVATTLYWALTPWPPGKPFNMARARQITARAFGIAGGRLTQWLNAYAGDFLVAFFLSTAAVGLYRMGVRLFVAASSIVLQAPMSGVMAMVGDAHRRGQSRLSVVVQRTMRLQLAFALPIFTLFGLLSPYFIPLLLGSEWTASGTVLRVLGLSAVQAIYFTSNLSVLTANGRTGVLFVTMALSGLSGFIGIAIGAQFGPVEAAIGQVVATTPLSIFYYYFLLGLPRATVLATLASTFATLGACAAMIIAVWGTQHILPSPVGTFAVLAQMALLSLVALTTYMAATWLIARKTFRIWRFIIQRNVERIFTKAALPAAG